MESSNQELVPLWANTDKRKAFLTNHKERGVWLTIPELGIIYYKYELPKGGGRIVVMEYQRETPYPMEGEELLQTITVYYLWEGEHFIPNSVGEYYIADRLKNLKAELQKEIRAGNTTNSRNA